MEEISFLPAYIGIPIVLLGAYVSIRLYRYVVNTIKEVSDPNPCAPNHNQEKKYYTSRFWKSIGALWLYWLCAVSYIAYPFAAPLAIVNGVAFYVLLWKYLFKHHNNMCKVIVYNEKLNNDTVSFILDISYFGSVLILGAIWPVIGHLILLILTSKKHMSTGGRCKNCNSKNSSCSLAEGPVRIKEKNHTSKSNDTTREGDDLVETTTWTTKYYREVYKTFYHVYRCENCGCTWETFSHEKLVEVIPIKTTKKTEERRY
jgi:hypothetical protein